MLSDKHSHMQTSTPEFLAATVVGVTSVTMTSPSEPFQMTWPRASLNSSVPDLAEGEIVGKVSSEHSKSHLCLGHTFAASHLA